ncbi:MAG: hypothetical protein ACOYO9_13595, partial [Candidatus Nanopelagicales bacterium]
MPSRLRRPSPRAAGPRRRALSGGFLATIALAAAVSLPAISLAPAAAAQPLAVPRVYGGTPANGNPAIVSIATFNGTSWPTGCTGGMLRGRLVLTASHCTTDSGSAAGVRGFALFNPG